jgi:hypothetical protein
MKINKLKGLINIYSLLIVQQIIIISIAYAFLIDKDLIIKYSFFYSIIYVSLIYLAVLLGYLRYNKSIKMAIVFGSLQYLILKPLSIVRIPEACGKCDYNTIWELISVTLIADFVYIIIMILLMVLFLSLSKFIPKLRWIYYLVPLIFIILLQIITGIQIVL